MVPELPYAHILHAPPSLLLEAHSFDHNVATTSCKHGSARRCGFADFQASGTPSSRPARRGIELNARQRDCHDPCTRKPSPGRASDNTSLTPSTRGTRSTRRLPGASRRTIARSRSRRLCWCGIPWSIVISASNSRWAASISSPFSLLPQLRSRMVTTSFSSLKKCLSLRSRFSSSNKRIHRFRRHLQVGDGLLAGDTRITLQEIFQRVSGRQVLDQDLYRHPSALEYQRPIHHLGVPGNHVFLSHDPQPPLSEPRLVDTNFARRVMSETIAAWLVDRGLVRPGIAAHAHARRVHNGKQHLWLITFVVLCVKLAIEGVLPFVHAEGADPTCVFTAKITLPEWCLVLAQEAHTLAADVSLALIYHTQLQLGGSAEVVDVLEAAAFAQDLAELDLHGAFVGICEHTERPHPVGGSDRVSDPINVEITEVAAAFQPFTPQEAVQLFEGGVGSHLHIHPENGRVGVFDPHTKEPCSLSAGRLVLSQAAPQMARHRRFGSTLTAEGASTVRGIPTHASHSSVSNCVSL